MKKIILIIIGITLLSNAEFTRNIRGVVSDSDTKLKWQDNYETSVYHDESGYQIKKANWHDALVYCNELILDGNSDWRLPNMNELMSLIDHSQFKTKINSIFEYYNDKDSYDDVFWSSTTYITHTDKAWGIGFAHGEDRKYNKEKSYFVRCVSE